MTGTLTDVQPVGFEIAEPVPGSRPATHGPGKSAAAAMWQDAKTVLVTRVVGPRQLVTAPRLVIPIGDNQIAFRVSSYSAEAEQLALDNRVIVQPGDWRSPILGSHQRQGLAQLVTAGTLLVHVQQATEAKYGWRMSLARFGHRMAQGSAPYGNIVVLVTVFDPGPLYLPPSANS